MYKQLERDKEKHMDTTRQKVAVGYHTDGMSGGILTTCIKTSQGWIKTLVEGVMLMGCNRGRTHFTTVNRGTSVFPPFNCHYKLFSTRIVLRVPNTPAACTLMRSTLRRHNLPHAEQD